MDDWRLTDEQLRTWLAALLVPGRRVVAPVAEDGLDLFREVRSADEIRLQPSGRTRWSVKEVLLPATETLFSYRYDGERVAIEVPPAEPDQVLVGLRPCDAAGTARLDGMLSDDEAYASRRERTVIVSVACAGAEPACFCTAVGGSPAGTEASDLQLVPLGGGWLLRQLTKQGAALVNGDRDGWPVAEAEDWAAAEDQRRAVEESINAEPFPLELATALTEHFEGPVWAAISERCLGCGVCAYVCPSCGCFDVTDVGNAFCGTRCRSWDSCGFARFTRHAAGHNPRPAQPARYRQRVMHKFAWYPLEHGSFMCVGCGRCVESCPVGIDIRQSVERVMTYERLPTPADADHGDPRGDARRPDPPS